MWPVAFSNPTRSLLLTCLPPRIKFKSGKIGEKNLTCIDRRDGKSCRVGSLLVGLSALQFVFSWTQMTWVICEHYVHLPIENFQWWQNMILYLKNFCDDWNGVSALTVWIPVMLAMTFPSNFDHFFFFLGVRKYDSPWMQLSWRIREITKYSRCFCFA